MKINCIMCSFSLGLNNRIDLHLLASKLCHIYQSRTHCLKRVQGECPMTFKIFKSGKIIAFCGKISKLNFNEFIQKTCRKFARSIQKNVYPETKFQNFKIENISFSWKPKIKEKVSFCKLISNIPLTNGKARYPEDGDRQPR